MANQVNQVLDNQKQLKENIDQVKNVDLKKLGHVVYTLIQSHKTNLRRCGSSPDQFQMPQIEQTPSVDMIEFNPMINTSQELISACYELLGNLSPVSKKASSKTCI